MNTPKKSNISKSTWMVLIGVAIFFDVLSLIPVVAEFVAIVYLPTFWLIFKMHGEEYSGKTLLGGFIIGLIPGVDMLPECTAMIVKLYFDAKARNALAEISESKKVVEMPKRQNSSGNELRKAA